MRCYTRVYRHLPLNERKPYDFHDGDVHLLTIKWKKGCVYAVGMMSNFLFFPSLLLSLSKTSYQHFWIHVISEPSASFTIFSSLSFLKPRVLSLYIRHQCPLKDCSSNRPHHVMQWIMHRLRLWGGSYWRDWEPASRWPPLSFYLQDLQNCFMWSTNEIWKCEEKNNGAVIKTN